MLAWSLHILTAAPEERDGTDITKLFMYFFLLYSTLLHLPPLSFHCADGCWDRTPNRCNWYIGSQVRRSNH